MKKSLAPDISGTALYAIIKHNGQWAVVLQSNKLKIQFSGPKWACLNFIEMN